MKKSNIYTRSGDDGTTALIGGRRIPKFHPRLEAYGTVDELNSFVGLIIPHLTDPEDTQTLLTIQNSLFVAGCELATALPSEPAPFSLRSSAPSTDSPHSSSASSPRHAITSDDVLRIEHAIDAIDALCGGWCGFILPGGTQGAALAHACRTICRRLERRLYALCDLSASSPPNTTSAPSLSTPNDSLAQYPSFPSTTPAPSSSLPDYGIPPSPFLLQYINRLSDYFFLLARKINFLSGVQENIWKNR